MKDGKGEREREKLMKGGRKRWGLRNIQGIKTAHFWGVFVKFTMKTTHDRGYKP